MTLTQTQRQFAAWRSNHRKRSRLPADLKRQAVALIGQHTRHQIIKALGISGTMLRDWQRGAGKSTIPRAPAVPPKPRRAAGTLVQPAFIDVTPLMAAHPAAPTTTLTVEITGRGTIKLAGDLSEAAVRAAVAAAFAVAPLSAGEVIL